MFRSKSIKMLVCDMAGTTINEGGIVYKTLYENIKNNNIYIEENEIKDWYGINKTQVLQHFINRDPKFKNDDTILPNLLKEFKQNLIFNYSNDGMIRLINPQLPQLFNSFREKNIKIALNSGFSVDIQETLIKNLKIDHFIDGYISSEEVPHGRPEPYMIRNLMDRFNITDSKNVIKLGDSMNDVLEGINSGCKDSIGVLSGAETKENLIKVGATKILNSVMDLQLEE